MFVRWPDGPVAMPGPLGSNGAGKTTSFDMIIGLEAVNEGSIQLDA